VRERGEKRNKMKR